MKLSPVGGNFCCAKNLNFRAKLSRESLENVLKPADTNFVNLIEDVNNFNKKLDVLGSKETEITINKPEDTTRFEHDAISSAYLCFSGEPGPQIDSDVTEYPEYKTELLFRNPLVPDEESRVGLSVSKRLTNTPYFDAAREISPEHVEQGETRLLVQYGDKLAESLKDSSEPLLVKAKDFITKVKEANFSENAVKTFTKYLKTIDLRNKLNKQIANIKKI